VPIVNEVFLRVFKDAKHTLVAVCDSDIMGKTYREGKRKLEVKEGFYKGVLSSIPEALREISSADVANLAGNSIVNAAVQEGFVDPSAIVRVAGISHVQIVRL
jgi:hypothetical protein